MEYKNILIEKENSISWITLNKPEIRNALNEETMAELIGAIENSNDDNQVRVIVIKGAGDKAFSAGGDLNNMLNQLSTGSSIEIQKFTGKYAKLVDTLIHSKKPTISAVQGYALAGGCGLAAICDITIASEKAVFGIPEINIGIWGAVISAPIIRIIGMKKAMELFYTGRNIKADEAEKIGLVNRVVPQEMLEQEVRAIAEAIAAKSPLALTMGREALMTIQDMELNKSLKYLQNMVTILIGSEDAKEGISSFLDKRTPNWKNR